MINLYILNQNFEVLSILDSYESIIWRPSYSEVGDFEIYMGATPEAVELLQPNRYVVRDIDISVVNGVITYKNVMIIKGVEITTDVENGDYLTITGRELKYLLHSRIIWSQTVLSGTAEAGIRSLIDKNAINPTNTRRVIPTLTLDAVKGLTDPIDKQITGDYLDEAIVDICTTYNYGWEIYINGNTLRFNLYTGLDRSYGQTDRPYVVFSDTFDNLYNTDYEMNCEEYANTTLIAGEGEGTARKTTTIGNTTHSGLDRFELYTDARDLSQNKGTDEAISDSDYYKLLTERGKEKLAEVEVTEGFSGEVLSNVAFIYGTDFYLGDVVTVINTYGISRNVQVKSAIESYDDNGFRLIPEFNM